MTHSGDPWTVSGMKANNARHEAPVREFLQAVVKNPPLHAKFMNMLSMLEHMGSRKIMVSQMRRTLTEDSLKHLAEEARHAYFFKRQAERVAGQALDGYTEENTMARVPALMYFGRLDAGISARAADAAGVDQPVGGGEVLQPVEEKRPPFRKEPNPRRLPLAAAARGNTRTSNSNTGLWPTSRGPTPARRGGTP